MRDRADKTRPLPDPAALLRIVHEEYGLNADDPLCEKIRHYARTKNAYLEGYIRAALSKLERSREELRLIGDHVPPQEVFSPAGIPLALAPRTDGEATAIVLDPDRLPLHSIFVGTPGSGKSMTTRRLLDYLTRLYPHVRILLFDPNRTYAHLASDPNWCNIDLHDLRLNPLAPPSGYGLDAWLTESLDILCLDELKHSKYLIHRRIDFLINEERKRAASPAAFRYPSLVNLRDNLAARKERPGSSMERYRETALNVIDGRVRACPSLYDCSTGMEGLVTRSRTRIATEGIGNVANLEFLFSHFVHSVAAQRSMEPSEIPPTLHTFIVLEEAQTLLQPRTAGITFYQEQLLKSRALGVGFLFIGQDLNRIDTGIVAAVNNFAVFCQSTRDNKRAVQATLDLSARETELLGKLPPGVCFLRFAGHPLWSYPFLATIPMEG